MFGLTAQRPFEPLMKKNRFRDERYAATPIPPFAEARSKLPIPIIPAYPAWEKMYWHAWEIAWQNLRQPLPESGFVNNFTQAGNQDALYMWDSAFSAHFGIYARRSFNFIQTLDNFYAKQHDDGFICREINLTRGYDLHTPYDPDSSGPNIFAWTEWRNFRMTGDEERLEKVFWPLLALHRWFEEHRTWPNGLYWTTGLASGMWNQRRVPGGMHFHRHWSWVDASMQASLNLLALRQIALVLDEEALAGELAETRAKLQLAINKHLWSDEAQFYLDVDRNGRYSAVKSAASYWGLLDKRVVPDDRLDEFVSHLREGWAFKRPHRVPSQSSDSPYYAEQSGDFWRGGVIPALNFMLLKGLRTVGQHGLANEIALNHLEQVCAVFEQTGTFWNYYRPEESAPGQDATPDFVGWTGLTPISILLEDVIGLMADWPQRRVMWDRRLHHAGLLYGVKNYPLGPEHTLDMVGNEEAVYITTDVPFTLVLRTDEMSLQSAIAAGTTEIPLN